MKKINLSHYFILVLILSGLFLNSCNKNNDPVLTDNQYIISNELKFGITSQEAVANLTTFQAIMPETSLLGTVAKNNIEVYKITYKTKLKDANIIASGLVCLPKEAGNYPVLCFQNGTNTLHSDAPTEDPKNDLFQILESVASMGFIVVMPDYIGFGASANIPHPYLHAASTTQSILDMLRATKEFAAEDKIVAKPTKDLFIFGYSQGGWATMELQKTIEKDYPTEFNLLASSCGAGPYSLEYMTEYITKQKNYLMPFYLAYLLNAYSTLGLFTNPLSDIFQVPYSGIIPGLFDGKHTGGTINSLLTDQIPNLLTPEYLAGYDTNSKFSSVKSAIMANSIEPWLISTPTRLYHGANDEYIPVSMSEKMFADFRTNGVPDTKIQLIIIPGVDHSIGVIPVGFSTILWFLSLKK
jgi:pimeloyl-ACP methyl ester carboxylesterase